MDLPLITAPHPNAVAHRRTWLLMALAALLVLSFIGGNVHIYTVKADGTGLTQVTSGDGSEFTPGWSPDGTTMAVDAAEPGLAEGISILDLATGTLTPITANPYGIFDAEPQYSPDGAWSRLRGCKASVPRAPRCSS